MTMAWEYRLRLPQIPCSKMEAVLGSFYGFTEQKKSQIKASLKYIRGVHQRDRHQRWGKFPTGSRCSPEAVLAFGLAEASCPVKSIESKRVLSIVTDVSSDKKGQGRKEWLFQRTRISPKKG